MEISGANDESLDKWRLSLVMLKIFNLKSRHLLRWLSRKCSTFSRYPGKPSF